MFRYNEETNEEPEEEVNSPGEESVEEAVEKAVEETNEESEEEVNSPRPVISHRCDICNKELSLERLFENAFACLQWYKTFSMRCLFK